MVLKVVMKMVEKLTAKDCGEGVGEDGCSEGGGIVWQTDGQTYGYWWLGIGFRDWKSDEYVFVLLNSNFSFSSLGPTFQCYVLCSFWANNSIPGVK